MGDAALEFLAAARGFRAAFVDHDPDDARSARRVRNAVARVYLAAVFLPSHSSEEAGGHEDLPLAESLAAIDEALEDAIASLEADLPGAVWDVRRDFEQQWGGHAVDVLRPLHRAATTA